ncbi:hypothetical protein DOTSEDRAFT_67595 [Dothistroma septosporum NZE10]|uniref:Uncharacterized protein n=1 Tax=Dothistroma septosporum (strain NZE10 / CBS 128990) TaxID=675120 RepID=N1Q1U9_DOTSN|nr:hypothetical protein DOTSEDRAFT_67595 [Dothistroma septosporum NZE10]
MAQRVTAGRVTIVVGNLLYSVGAFAADFNETHVLNPRWPPHAKFHNGQTMSLAVLLASASLYYLFRPAETEQQRRDNVFTSALMGSLYCFAGMCAILYPETAWQDPEFDQGGEQRYLFSGICVAMAIGYLLESSRLTKTKNV